MHFNFGKHADSLGKVRCDVGLLASLYRPSTRRNSRIRNKNLIYV